MTSKEYAHEYYLKHKQEILERNKKWRQNNKERFYELVYKSRKKKAQELKELGLNYIWNSEKERKRLYERRTERFNRTYQEKEISNNDNKE